MGQQRLSNNSNVSCMPSCVGFKKKERGNRVGVKQGGNAVVEIQEEGYETARTENGRTESAVDIQVEGNEGGVERFAFQSIAQRMFETEAQKKEKLEQQKVVQCFDNHQDLIIKVNDIKVIQNRYIIKKRNVLQKSEIGRTYECECRRSQDQRMIKIINKSQMTQTQAKNIVNEVGTLQHLNHPSILKLYEAYQDDNQVYLVYEKFIGQNLSELIKQKSRLEEKHAARIMLQVVQALAHCHWQSIVHRDVRPDKILVKTIDRGVYEVKLVGFGMAAFLNPGEKLTDVVSYHQYIAPEMLQQNYDHKCDIWACGIIIHEMVLGHTPFKSRKDNELIEKIKQTQKPGGEIDYKKVEYTRISSQVVDILRKFLFTWSDRRISAEGAASHRWFIDNIIDKRVSISEQNNNICLQQKVNEFNKKLKTQKAIQMFLQKSVGNCDDYSKIDQSFKQLHDTMGTEHRMNEREFANSLRNLDQLEDPDSIAEKIFKIVETDVFGQIEMNEFLNATRDYVKMRERSHLRVAKFSEKI